MEVGREGGKEVRREGGKGCGKEGAMKYGKKGGREGKRYRITYYFIAYVQRETASVCIKVDQAELFLKAFLTMSTTVSERQGAASILCHLLYYDTVTSKEGNCLLTTRLYSKNRQ